jgi:hypothetical protein
MEDCRGALKNGVPRIKETSDLSQLGAAGSLQ